MEEQLLELPIIKLRWSDWIPWEVLKQAARKGEIRVPNDISGVYETAEGHLTIGRDSDLRMRIKQSLV